MLRQWKVELHKRKGHLTDALGYRLPPRTYVRTRALRLPDSWNQKKKGKEDESLRAFAKFHYVRSFTSCYFNALMLEKIYFLVLLDPDPTLTVLWFSTFQIFCPFELELIIYNTDILLESFIQNHENTNWRKGIE